MTDDNVTSIQMTFAVALKEAMAKSKGKRFCDVKDVSRHFNVTVGTVHRWLRGEQIPQKRFYAVMASEMPQLAARWPTHDSLYDWWERFKFMRERSRKKSVALLAQGNPTPVPLPAVVAEVVPPPSFLDPSPPLTKVTSMGYHPPPSAPPPPSSPPPLQPSRGHLSQSDFVTKDEFAAWAKKMEETTPSMVVIEQLYKRIDNLILEMAWLTQLRGAVLTFLKMVGS